MAHVINFIIPPMGEPIEAARLVSWTVQQGESFQRGDVLLEIETDKSVVEIPASESGRMIEHLLDVDGVLNSDTPVARIEVEGEPEIVDSALPPAPAEANVVPIKSETRVAGSETAFTQADPALESPSYQGRPKSTPAARRLARERGQAIDGIVGSGPGGRVVQADVLRAAKTGRGVGVMAPNQQNTGNRGRAQFTVATEHGDINVARWIPHSPRDVPMVVLVHGMFGDMDTWSSLISALNRAGLNVLVMDLPCHGKSQSLVTGLSDVVQALTEVVVAQATGPVILVGHSFGAALSARLARQQSMNVDSLVLIAPVGLGTEIEQGFLTGMNHAATSEALARELRKLTVSDITLSADYLHDFHVRLQGSADHLGALCNEIGQHGVQQIDIVPDLRQMAIPTTVIQGRRDRIIPWKHALNAPPQTALHIIPEAGHMPQWDATALVSDIIVRHTT